MNLIQKFTSLFRPDIADITDSKSQSLTSQELYYLLGPGNAQWINPSYGKLVNDGYTNPYVYAAVKYIARNTAVLPWKLVQSGSTVREATVVETHPLLDLLKYPNDEQGKAEFFEEMISYLLISGDAYILANGSMDNLNRPPVELINLRPDRVTPNSNGQMLGISSYSYNTGNGSPIYPTERIIHFKEFNPNPIIDEGLSPMVAGSKSIAMSNESREWNMALLQNGASPTGVLVATDNVSKEVKARLKEQFKSENTGARNAGKPLALLEGGLDWKQISLTPQQMGWADLQNLTAREIAIVYMVPSQLLGIPDSQTYSNYKEARESFVKETLLPLAYMIRDKFNRKITTLYGDNLYLDLDTDKIEELSENKTEVYARVGTAYQQGIMSREEARSRIGLDPEAASGDTFANQGNQ